MAVAWRQAALHPLDDADAQQLQSFPNDPRGQMTQQESPLAQFWCWCAQHRAILKEATVALGAVPEIRSDDVRLEFRGRRVQRLVKAQKLQRQGSFLRLLQGWQRRIVLQLLRVD